MRRSRNLWSWDFSVRAIGEKKKNFSEERGLSYERNIFIYLQSELEARSYEISDF